MGDISNKRFSIFSRSNFEWELFADGVHLFFVLFSKFPGSTSDEFEHLCINVGIYII